MTDLLEVEVGGECARFKWISLSVCGKSLALLFLFLCRCPCAVDTRLLASCYLCAHPSVPLAPRSSAPTLPGLLRTPSVPLPHDVVPLLVVFRCCHDRSVGFRWVPLPHSVRSVARRVPLLP